MEADRLARFWAKVDKSGECWVWTAALHTTGYGIFGIGGKRVDRAHRISWAIANGPIPEGAHILHHCDNRPCVNPAHLFIGTNQDNVNDCIKKGRHSPPPPMGGWNKKAIPDEIISRLGKQSDSSLASECGVDKGAMRKRRSAMGIPPWADSAGHPTRFRVGQPHPRWSKKGGADAGSAR